MPPRPSPPTPVSAQVSWGPAGSAVVSSEVQGGRARQGLHAAREAAVTGAVDAASPRHRLGVDFPPLGYAA